MASVAINTQPSVLNQISNFASQKAAYLGEIANKVASGVRSFFTETVPAYFNIAKNFAAVKFNSLRQSFSLLSTQNKVIAGSLTGLAIAALSYVAYKALGKKAEVKTEETAKEVPPATPAKTDASAASTTPATK